MVLTISELQIILKATGVEATKAQLKGLKSELDNTGKSTKLAKDDFANFGKQLGETNAKALAHRLGTVALAGALLQLSKSCVTAALDTEKLTGKAKENAETVKTFSKDWEKASAVVGGVVVSGMAKLSKAMDYAAGIAAGLNVEQIKAISLARDRATAENELRDAIEKRWAAEEKTRIAYEDSLARELALLSQKTELDKKIVQAGYDWMDALTKLKTQYDKNGDGILQQSEMTAEYTSSVERANKIHEISINNLKADAAAKEDDSKATEKLTDKQVKQNNELERYNRLMAAGINPGNGNKMAANNVDTFYDKSGKAYGLTAQQQAAGMAGGLTSQQAKDRAAQEMSKTSGAQ